MMPIRREPLHPRSRVRLCLEDIRSALELFEADLLPVQPLCRHGLESESPLIAGYDRGRLPLPLVPQDRKRPCKGAICQGAVESPYQAVFVQALIRRAHQSIGRLAEHDFRYAWRNVAMLQLAWSATRFER